MNDAAPDRIAAASEHARGSDRAKIDTDAACTHDRIPSADGGARGNELCELDATPSFTHDRIAAGSGSDGAEPDTEVSFEPDRTALDIGGTFDPDRTAPAIAAASGAHRETDVGADASAVVTVRACVRQALAQLVATERAIGAGRVPGHSRNDADASPPLRIAVALSGGRDSLTLLDSLAAVAREAPVVLSAVHVHHGLQPQAQAWVDACREACATRGIALVVERVAVDRAPGGDGPEASARRARYEALRRQPVDVIALAHHADDQAETLLLQLVRGAGPAGLAAMPLRRARDGTPSLWRPMLGLARDAIEACARARGLAWVDDPSNADPALRRNALRLRVTRELGAIAPGYPHTLVRAAALQAEADELLEALAVIDAQEVAIRDDDGMGLSRAALAALAARSPARARNLLRWFLRRHDLAPPSAARLAAMLAQCAGAAPDARVRLAHAGIELGLHRDTIRVHAPATEAFDVPWSGEDALALPGGVLEFRGTIGRGMARSRLASGPVRIRSRRGGESLRLQPDRPRHSVRKLWQANGTPAWARAATPFVWCGDALAAVPALGVDVGFHPAPDEPAIELAWHPRAVVAASGPAS